VRDRAIELGYIENDTGQHQSNTVYSPDGLSPSITTFGGGGYATNQDYSAYIH
jgi:hypothetical protein